MIFSKVVVTHNRLPEIIKEFPKTASKAIAKVTFDGDAELKSLVPVDTGRLKGSIEASMVDDFTGNITLGTEYMWYVEYGTYKMRAQPFIRPSVEKMRSSLQRAAEIMTEEL